MDRNQAIAQFVSINGCTPEVAEFYLDANRDDLNAAMLAYLENQDNNQHAAATASSSSSAPIPQPAASASASARSSGQEFSASQKKSRSGPSSKLRTFSDLNQDSSEDDGDRDELQNYFAGGEKSGVMMQAPSKKANREGADLVENILKKAQEGSEAIAEREPTPPEQRSFFGGAGHRLGTEAEPAPTAGPSGLPRRAGTPPQNPAISMKPVERKITFWKDGFSIDDGELKSYDDPENQEFLRAIQSGRAPTSFLNVAYGQPVELRVAERRSENYAPPPKKPTQAFSGAGQRLGGVSSSASGEGFLPGGFPSGSASATAAAAGPDLVVDNTQPVTSIQLRLADGTRLVSKFNHTHTVGDIRAFINRSRPGEAARGYVLMTTFPNKQLTDASATLKDAGLLNAVIVQRYA
ncbi:uncharacterized protein BJ171DRAFT_487088 [Polychytrium aggregatum]|uniref:uncharacterized protein n=1 Tax=Polychytrium aggregatum TaxID=110093 RepID=UPI0022FDEFE3|nr:uncharacterized protein BJ171DRAFT_487088 [Polychytrium aggregatum]KAI9209461.1 hypothetical protein BJ171DRAFT_487088 [Polychytrium aggregatum]